MLASGIPAKFNIPWANGAGGSFIRPIPQASQIGVQDGAASLTDGFPPLNFVPVASGGVPPFGQDFNGILKQITQWAQWYSAGGPIVWDSAFSSAVGGYPAGALVASAVTVGILWISTADNNTSNPDTGGANWLKIDLTSALTAGDAKLTLKTVADPGWVMADDGTIGNASSGGTTRANADTVNLFTVLWNNVSNTFAAVSGGRGGTAAADFAANKNIALTKVLGRALIVAGAGSGLTARSLGQTLGEETHLMTLSELVSHNHGNPAAGAFLTAGGAGGSYPATGSSATPATATAMTGGSTPFNVMQPSTAWNLMVKL